VLCFLLTPLGHILRSLRDRNLAIEAILMPRSPPLLLFPYPERVPLLLLFGAEVDPFCRHLFSPFHGTASLSADPALKHGFTSL